MRSALVICMTAWLLAGPPALAESRYGSWGGPGGDTQELVDKLRKLTREAEQARAADRRFIADLWALIDQYDNPWTATLVSDNFRDGDFTRNPRWTLASGDYRVDARLGLVSEVHEEAVPATARDETRPGSDRSDPGAELAIALLGSLLNETQRGRQEKPEPSPAPTPSAGEPASLYIDQRVPDTFSLTVELEALGPEGEYIIEIYRDRPGGDGYAVIFRPGDRRPFELVRTDRGRTAVVETGGSSRGDAFELVWTRKDNGEMALSVGGKRLFKVTDRTWKDGFGGLSLTNLEGRFAVRRVELLGGRS